MSEAAKNARDAMRAKAKRLTSTDPHEKVDSSTWTPPEPEDAGVKTGARPLVKRLYKKGGKVVGKAEGNKSAHRADRKPRKAGGKVEHKAPWIDDFINRDVRMANDEREGIKHVGGFKKGGKAHKFGGGMIGNNPIADQNMALGKAAGMKPATTMKKGGKIHRDAGGKTPSAKVPMPPRRYEDEDVKGMSPEQIQELMYGSDPYGSDRTGGAAPKKDGGKIKWIQGAIKHPGSLHKALHVPAGEKIPEKKLKKAEHSENPKLAKKAHLAETLKHMHHAKGGKAEHKHINKADELADKDLIKSMVKHSALQHKKHGGEAHPHDCTCHKCSGGRMGKYSGGGIFSGDSEKKIPGVVPGGRSAHAKGGKAKGKTNVNIIIGTGHGQQQPPMGMMPNAPVPAPLPQRLPPAPGGMPPGGIPPMGPQGAPPMPPQGMPPMGRKSGGRAYPIDSGSGGGEARLEKIDAYGLKPAKMK